MMKLWVLDKRMKENIRTLNIIVNNLIKKNSIVNILDIKDPYL
jgi:hypothetical protein